jgi:putative ABC transport system permease protein
VLHDLRYALRLIRTTPVASAIAILTVAIGVGANAAIFSIIHAVLLKPLPYQHADRLVQISESWPSRPGPRPVSRLNYIDWTAQSDVFDSIAAVSWGSATIGGAGLKPGVTVAQARAQLNTIADRLAAEYPDANKGYGVIVEPFPRPVGLDVEASFYLLFAAVGIVLLIACVNLANLAIVRATARARDLAIRAALGASRAQIVRQFLVEQLVIAAAGGVAGVAVAWMALRIMVPVIPTTGLRAAYPEGTAIAIDRVVWLFAMGVSTISGIGFGLSPALAAARRPLAETIRDGAPGMSAARDQRYTRQILVVAEVALAVVLLTGAGLLIQSFFTLRQRIDAGFDRTSVLTAVLPMPASRVLTGATVNRYLDEIGGRIQALPGVRDVAFADAVPPQAFPYGKLIQIVGEPVVPFASRLNCGFKVVSPSYFRTIGLHLIDGRPLSAEDRDGAPFVLVVNQTMAREFFPGTNPIGRRILLRRFPLQASAPVPDDVFTIVGVVADEGVSPFERTAMAGAYATREQHPRRTLNLVVRASVPPQTLAEPIRRSVAAVDRDQAVADVKTIDQLEAEDVAPDRLRSILLTAFAAVAVLLTTLGVYGVIAQGVLQRTREIGIRTALGASTWRILRLVLGQGLAAIAIGLAVGVVGSIAVLRLLRAFLFGVGPADPITIAAVAVVMAVVALIACYLPARQATRVDPLIAFKTE